MKSQNVSSGYGEGPGVERRIERVGQGHEQHAQNREVDILVIEGAGPKVAEKYLVLGGGEVVGTGVEGPAEVEEMPEARFCGGGDRGR